MGIEDRAALIQMSICKQYFSDEWEIDFDSIFDDNFLNLFHEFILFLIEFGEFVYHINELF